VLAAYGLLADIASALKVTRTVVGTVRPNQTHAAGTFTLKNFGTVVETLTGVDLSFSNPSLFNFAKLTAKRGSQTRSVKVISPGSSNTFSSPKPLMIPPGKTAPFTLAVNGAKGGAMPSLQTVTGIESTNKSVTGVPANLGQLSPPS